MAKYCNVLSAELSKLSGKNEAMKKCQKRLSYFSIFQ